MQLDLSMLSVLLNWSLQVSSNPMLGSYLFSPVKCLEQWGYFRFVVSCSASGEVEHWTNC